MSSGDASPRELLARRSFRVRHSIWLLVPIFGLGMLTWTSFLYIGIQARRWSWILAGVGYAVATSVIFFFVDGTEGPNGRSDDWTGGAIIAVWIAGIVHAMLVNPAWLRWRAQKRTPWYAAEPGGAPPPSPPPVPAPSPIPALPPPLAAAADPRAYWTPGRPVDVRPLDVNTAQAHELGALPGMTVDRVRRVLHERQARGGFGGVAEFADAAGLAPHEHHRIRELVTCSPPPRQAPPPGPGRMLDY